MVGYGLFSKAIQALVKSPVHEGRTEPVPPGRDGRCLFFCRRDDVRVDPVGFAKASIGIAVIGLLISALFMAGCCRLDAWETDYNTGRQAAIRRMRLQSIALPAEPVDLREQQVVPDRALRQTFVWGPHHHEWRLRAIQPDLQSADFILRHPVDLAQDIEELMLYFEIDPPDKANSLVWHLMYRDQAAAHGVASDAYRITRRLPSDHAAFAIPLTAFDQLDPPPDWTRIQAVRIDYRPIDAAETTDAITIHNLQFAPQAWVRAMQHEPDE